jgi:hypothetical protein
MNDMKKLYGIRYYLMFAAVLLSVYIYASLTGWRFLDAVSSGKAQHYARGYHK